MSVRCRQVGTDAQAEVPRLGYVPIVDGNFSRNVEATKLATGVARGGYVLSTLVDERDKVRGEAVRFVPVKRVPNACIGD
jgi:hypothetical protein